MKRTITLLLIIISQFSFAQNLVPNPSFELYNACPNFANQIYNALSWHSTRSTGDYFNSCDTGYNWASVPTNYFGTRTPASGNAYAGGIEMQANSTREYIGAQLISPLQIGMRYYFSLKISLAGHANISNYCGINKLGALFSNILYDSISPAPICNCAQIYTDSIITDTLNWTRITGSFIADSNYSFINIGNFFDNGSTNSKQIAGTGPNAYYYFDDCCVSTDSEYTFNYKYVGINNFIDDESIMYFPNPFKDIITIEDKEGVLQEVKIYSITGQILNSYSLKGLREYTFDLFGLPQGIYILSIYMKNSSAINKIIIKL